MDVNINRYYIYNGYQQHHDVVCCLQSYRNIQNGFHFYYCTPHQRYAGQFSNNLLNKMCRVDCGLTLVFFHRNLPYTQALMVRKDFPSILFHLFIYLFIYIYELPNMPLIRSSDISSYNGANLFVLKKL